MARLKKESIVNDTAEVFEKNEVKKDFLKESVMTSDEFFKIAIKYQPHLKSRDIEHFNGLLKERIVNPGDVYKMLTEVVELFISKSK